MLSCWRLRSNWFVFIIGCCSVKLFATYKGLGDLLQSCLAWKVKSVSFRIHLYWNLSYVKVMKSFKFSFRIKFNIGKFKSLRLVPCVLLVKIHNKINAFISFDSRSNFAWSLETSVLRSKHRHLCWICVANSWHFHW